MGSLRRSCRRLRLRAQPCRGTRGGLEGLQGAGLGAFCTLACAKLGRKQGHRKPFRGLWARRNRFGRRSRWGRGVGNGRGDAARWGSGIDEATVDARMQGFNTWLREVLTVVLDATNEPGDPGGGGASIPRDGCGGRSWDCS